MGRGLMSTGDSGKAFPKIPVEVPATPDDSALSIGDDSGKDFPKRRGRPRVLDAGLEEFYRSFVMENDPATLRTVQNQAYCGHALNILCDDTSSAKVTPATAEKVGWLLRPDADGHVHPRRSIMYQLGRIRHPEVLKIFAEHLCVIKPTAQDAMWLIRRWHEDCQSALAVTLVRNGTVTDDNAKQIAVRVLERKYKTFGNGQGWLQVESA